MSPHTKRSAKLPNASSFFPPPPVLSPTAALFPRLSNAPAAALPPSHSLHPPTSRRRARTGAAAGGKSQTRRAAFGGAAAPARPWRGAAAGEKAKRAAPLLAARRLPHGLGGARRLPWDGWLPLGGGLAQAAAGSHKAAKGDKMPLLSRIRAKILRKVLQFAPPCVILCMPRNSIDNVTRYKRAFLYLFFSCDFIYAKE